MSDGWMDKRCASCGYTYGEHCGTVCPRVSGGDGWVEDGTLDGELEHIRNIDEGAYMYLMSDESPIETDGPDLTTMFTFSDDPAGHDYWVDIQRKINERRRKIKKRSNSHRS